MAARRTPRQCPRCGHHNAATLRECDRCMTSLIVAPWRMTANRVRYVQVLARAQKGLSEEFYRLRLGAVGVDSCKKLKRAQYAAFVHGLKRLPDVPGWRRKQRRML